LGIIPFINASILIDLLTTLFPSLEKLQSEEGEAGRQKLNFYKKALTLVIATIQSGFLIFYLKSYFYTLGSLNIGLIGLELVTGSMIIVWMCGVIDKQGLGNGTSLIIMTNIIGTIYSQNILVGNSSKHTLELIVLLFFIFLITITQSSRINIEVVSARQLAFLGDIEKKKLKSRKSNSLRLKENGLSIRLNQAGIFPIIIASNLAPLTSYFTGIFGQLKFLNPFIYYLLIIGFNYFYTIIFWDPEKISEQLRKASVSVVNVTPGKDTISYLENIVRSASITGGISLCIILFLYEIFKQLINGTVLNQINISSLIILVGVAYDLQKTTRAIFKNVIEDI